MEPDVENNCELFIAEREKKLQSIENLRLKEQLWLVKNGFFLGHTYLYSC